MFELNEKVSITSQRGCSLYENDETYSRFLNKSRDGIVTETKRDIAMVFNGYSSMWFYQTQLIDQRTYQETCGNGGLKLEDLCSPTDKLNPMWEAHYQRRVDETNATSCENKLDYIKNTKDGEYSHEEYIKRNKR